MAILSKEQILAATDLKTEIVEVPEWGGEVIVSTMSGAARDAYEADLIKSREDQSNTYANLRARLAARCIVNEAGERMFDDSDLEALGAKSAAALDRVFSVAIRLNAMTSKDVDDLAKN